MVEFRKKLDVLFLKNGSPFEDGEEIIDDPFVVLGAMVEKDHQGLTKLECFQAPATMENLTDYENLFRHL